MILCVLLSLLPGPNIELNCYGFDLRMSFPDAKYEYSFDNKVEGTYYYFLFEDKVGLVVQCVANTARSAMRGKTEKTQSLKIDGYEVTRSIGYENDNEHMWIEDIYLGVNLTIRVRNLSGDSVGLYKAILNNSNIEKSEQLPPR